jgi:hypothetical protein
MTIALERELAHEGLLESISNQQDHLILRQPFKLEDIRRLDSSFADKLESKQKDLRITISFPFIKTLADLLKEKRDFCRNFVLTGPPSAGKTTELRSIATYLHEYLPTASKKILHFCSIQNTSASHPKIESADDLWNLILSSHCSKHWANKNSTPVEFLQWHEDCGFEPILFIDTIDLLTYGINFLNTESQGQKNIAKYWEELMEILNSNEKVKPSILWSSREIEWNELSENIDLGKKSSPKGCKIKSLSPTDVDGKGIAEIFQRRENKQFFRYLQQSFPILAGYARRNILPEEVISRLLEQLENISFAADYKPMESYSPILWILKEMNESFATDILYNTLVEKICEKTVRAFEDEFELREVVRIWQEGVEEVFFHESLPQYNIGGRIQVKIEPDSEVLEHLLYLANINGLLKEHWGKVYEMGHQLFVEYCIYKHGKDSDSYRKKLLGFPSIWLRFLQTEEPPNSEKNIKRYQLRVDEAKDWLYPFAVFNKKLVHYREDQLLSPQWTELINLATSVQESNEVASIPGTEDTNSIHWLNDEKREMLESHKHSQFPLLINGPPGVGKSHISFVWADSKSFQISGRKWVPVNEGKNDDIRKASLKDEQLNAMFMTLNRNLIEQQKNRIKEYYKGSIFKPLSWNTFDIESYIEELCVILNIQWKKLDYRLFEQRFRTEKIRSLKLPYLNDVRRKTIPSLWLEYNTNYINIDGKKRTTAEYTASRSKLFGTNDDDDETEARMAFADYCESEFERYKSIPEISGTILEKILEIETLGTREEKERLQTLKSDILILDEVQDLTAPIISLLLVMHRGPLNSIMICGDNEQTLLITPFSWERTFSRIHTLFYKKHKEFSRSSQLSKLLQVNWGERAEKYIQDLIVVERNVKDIVNFIADSWNTSIGSIVSQNLDIPVRGAGAVLPGQRSIDKEKSLQSQGKRTGVFQQDIDREELFKVCEKIYESDQDAAVVFTDERIQDEFYKELEQKNISIPLFTPSNIKGLEYPVIIAVSPWSMDVEIIQEYLKSDLDSWGKIINYYNLDGNSNVLRKRIIEDIALQRKRFANIIISRAENILMVYNLTSNTPENQDRFIHFDKPETFSSKKQMKLDYSLWDTKFDGMIDQELSKKANKSADRLIARLCTMIDSANHKENQKEISMQALHVGHVLQQQLSNHSEMNRLLLPFKLIGDYDPTCQLERPEVTVKKLLEEIENICGRISIHNWIHEQGQSVKLVKERDNLQIPFSKYCNFEKELKENEFSKVFSPRTECYSENFEKRTGLNTDSASEKIETYLMKLYLTKLCEENSNLDENPRRWLDVFSKLDEKTNSVKLSLNGREVKNPKNKIFELLMDSNTKNKAKSDKHMLDDASSFWESGSTLLENDEYDKQWKGRKSGFSQDEKDKIFTKLLEYETLESQRSEPALHVFFEKLFPMYVSSTDYSKEKNKHRIKNSINGLFRLSPESENDYFIDDHKYYILKYLQGDVDLLRKLVDGNPVQIWSKLETLLQTNEHEIKDEKILIEKKQINLSKLANTLFQLLHEEAEKGNLSTHQIKNNSSGMLLEKVMPALRAIIESNLFSIQKFNWLTKGPVTKSPTRFTDLFGLKTTSKSVRDYFLNNIDSDSQKSIILQMFSNIYSPFANHYKDGYDLENEIKNASREIEQMVSEIEKYYAGDELKDLFDSSVFERILQIPNFEKNQQDMVFERRFNDTAKLLNGINDEWLQMVRNQVLLKISNIEPKIIQKVEHIITEIRVDNFHFNRIYQNDQNKNYMMRKHISQHIQDQKWVSMCLKGYSELDQEIKDNLLKHHFIDPNDKEKHIGLFSHYDLMVLYNLLKDTRKEWRSIISNLSVYKIFESLPPIPRGLLISQYSEHGTVNWAELPQIGITREIMHTINLLENDGKRKKLVQNLQLAVNIMTEPSFFLDTMLHRFDKIIRGDSVYWLTLRNDLFTKYTNNPQLFATAVKSDKRIQLRYADFENCILNSTKFIQGNNGLFSERMDALVNSFIRLIQSYGIPVSKQNFDPNLVETTTGMNKEKIRTDSETFDQELALRLRNEIRNLPTLELKDD